MIIEEECPYCGWPIRFDLSDDQPPRTCPNCRDTLVWEMVPDEKGIRLV